MKKDFIEKSIDMQESGYEYEIRKHLANGWFIHHEGTLYITMRKYIDEVK